MCSNSFTMCNYTVKTDWLFYPGCMVYFGTIGQLYKTTSFLVVSTSFHSEMRKSIGNKEETTSLFFFITFTKLKHATRVITLWLKQPICFYSVATSIVCLYNYISMQECIHR